jgi:hypothetical protein
VSEETRQEHEDDTDEDTGGERKIDREMIPFDQNISREFSQIGNFASQANHDAHSGNEESNDNECSAHGLVFLF